MACLFAKNAQRVKSFPSVNRRFMLAKSPQKNRGRIAPASVAKISVWPNELELKVQTAADDLALSLKVIVDEEGWTLRNTSK